MSLDEPFTCTGQGWMIITSIPYIPQHFRDARLLEKVLFEGDGTMAEKVLKLTWSRIQITGLHLRRLEVNILELRSWASCDK